ncbi:MAG: glycoside hydrolase family 95 protein [Bacteroides sp.]|nr:glycoside hydrolase family 95 protein [Bacteroides sp.]
MKNFFFLSFFLFTGFLFAGENPLKLWYNKPANRFEEALPLGNGRLGVMVYGGVEREVLNLNEETLWGGGPTNANPTPDTPDYLPAVREELFRGNWSEASRILRTIQGPNCQSFVPLGNLYLDQDIKGSPVNYYRELDLERAVSTTRYTIDSVEYIRELFVSAPDQVIVMKICASRPGSIHLRIRSDTPFEGSTVKSVSSSEFLLSGQLPWQINSARNFPLEYIGVRGGKRGMRYQYRVKALTVDGTLTTVPDLQITGATEVTLFVSAATSFNGYDKRPDLQGKDEEPVAREYLENAVAKEYDELLENHRNDYQSYFNRLELYLGENEAELFPTDVRLKNYAAGKEDPSLEALYFQFGRYLLISCSRPGGVPANLHGIWNHRTRPSWGSNFTTNINLQMNYWPAEPLALGYLTEPLISFIQQAAVTGKEVASNFYKMKGWTLHHNSDIWAHANPVGHQKGDPKWANWSLGSPWLSQHLYEHYRFTMDKAYLLETAYPLMKEVTEFCKEWMVEKDGYLITAPSTSPENVFIDEKGNKGVVTIASTMDMQII